MGKITREGTGGAMQSLNLINHIDAWLVRERDSRERTSHYPSQASALDQEGRPIGKCLRAQWYAWKGTPKSNAPDATAIWKFRAGDAIHEVFPAMLREAGFDLCNEVAFKVTPPGLAYPVSGRVDSLIELNGETVGVEIKSTYGQGLTNKKSGVKYCGAKPEHLLQIITYLHCTTLDKFILVYLARDNFYRTQFLLQKAPGGGILVNGEVADITFNDIIKRWKVLEEALSTNSIPDRDYFLKYPEDVILKKYIEYRETSSAKKLQSLEVWGKDRGDWQCSYCDYSDLCNAEI